MLPLQIEGSSPETAVVLHDAPGFEDDVYCDDHSYCLSPDLNTKPEPVLTADSIAPLLCPSTVVTSQLNSAIMECNTALLESMDDYVDCVEGVDEQHDFERRLNKETNQPVTTSSEAGTTAAMTAKNYYHHHKLTPKEAALIRLQMMERKKKPINNINNNNATYDSSFRSAWHDLDLLGLGSYVASNSRTSQSTRRNKPESREEETTIGSTADEAAGAQRDTSATASFKTTSTTTTIPTKGRMASLVSRTSLVEPTIPSVLRQMTCLAIPQCQADLSSSSSFTTTALAATSQQCAICFDEKCTTPTDSNRYPDDEPSSDPNEHPLVFAELPCCGGYFSTKTSGQTKQLYVCTSCVLVLLTPTRSLARVGHCPVCRAWISVASPNVGKTGKLSIDCLAVASDNCDGICCECQQAPSTGSILLDNSNIRTTNKRQTVPKKDQDSSLICDACFLGQRNPLLYTCQSCHETQQIPYPLYRSQVTPHTPSTHTWPCASDACTSRHSDANEEDEQQHWSIRADQVGWIPVGDVPPTWGLDSLTVARAKVQLARNKVTPHEDLDLQCPIL